MNGGDDDELEDDDVAPDDDDDDDDADDDDDDDADSDTAAEAFASTYTVLRDNRLVAYLAPVAGTLRLAGKDPARQISFADVEVFDGKTLDTVFEILERAEHFPALLFELGLAGLVVEAGRRRPHAHLRRF